MYTTGQHSAAQQTCGGDPQPPIPSRPVVTDATSQPRLEASQSTRCDQAQGCACACVRRISLQCQFPSQCNKSKGEKGNPYTTIHPPQGTTKFNLRSLVLQDMQPLPVGIPIHPAPCTHKGAYAITERPLSCPVQPSPATVNNQPMSARTSQEQFFFFFFFTFFFAPAPPAAAQGHTG